MTYIECKRKECECFENSNLELDKEQLKERGWLITKEGNYCSWECYNIDNSIAPTTPTSRGVTYGTN